MKGYYGYQNDFYDNEEDDKPQRLRCDRCKACLPKHPNIGWTERCGYNAYDTYAKSDDPYDIGTLDKHIIEGESVVNMEGWKCQRCGSWSEGMEVGKPRDIVYDPPIILQWREVSRGSYEAVNAESEVAG